MVAGLGYRILTARLLLAYFAGVAATLAGMKLATSLQRKVRERRLANCARLGHPLREKPKSRMMACPCGERYQLLGTRRCKFGRRP